MVRLRSGVVCVTGNYRDNNEDNFFVDPDGRFFIVADGMGGQSAGEKASAMAVEHVPKKLNELIDFENSSTEEIVKSVDQAVAFANAEIMALGEIDPNARNMGTTIVLMAAVGDQHFIAGVGDSRVYLLKDGKLEQLTVDHSLTRALQDAGTITEEEAKTHRYRNVLYRYLGSKEGGSGTEATYRSPVVGERYVLCSDGVMDGIEDDVIQKVLEAHIDPQEAAAALVDAALEAGSKDNVTSIVVNVEEA
ncbi:MAG: protein phosphatase 2C domain-containing protein [Planctomycetota bacterium]|nr:protein phosphatase 2C domain-containing protein [Planctomycetota bacterium]